MRWVVLGVFYFRVEASGAWMSPFCGLLASFLLECGVAGAVLWGNGGAVPRGLFVWFA